MAALTADVHIPMLGNTGVKLGIPAVAGGDTFYAGGLVFGDASAGLAQAVPAAGDVFLGICAKQKVAAAGEIVEVYINGTFLIPYDTPVVADVGRVVVLDSSEAGKLTDNPADLVQDTAITVAANDMLIGQIIRIQGSAGWVTLHQGIGLYVATAGWGG